MKQLKPHITRYIIFLALGTMGIKAIRLVKLEEIPGAKEELKKIRRRFYDWMKNPAYLKSLIAQGKISEDDIKKKVLEIRIWGNAN